MICYTSDPLSLLPKEVFSTFTLVLPSGAMVELVPTEGASYRVHNLVSTDPQEYLSSPFRPGQVISGKLLGSCSCFQKYTSGH